MDLNPPSSKSSSKISKNSVNEVLLELSQYLKNSIAVFVFFLKSFSQVFSHEIALNFQMIFPYRP